MDSSTPVRNNVLTVVGVSDFQSDKEYATNEHSKDSREHSRYVADVFFVRNTEKESLCPNLNKSVELFPCSPIVPRNIPCTLLPLLDTPNYQWSDSILTPNSFNVQNELSPPIQPEIVSDGENFDDETPVHSVDSSQMCNNVESTNGSVFKQLPNSVTNIQHAIQSGSPVIQANQKSKKLHGNKGINKKLFTIFEGDSTNAESGEFEFSYQHMGDMTLSAMEQVCQISENMYSSVTSSCNEMKTNDSKTSTDSPANAKDCLAAYFDNCQSYRRKFVYPYDKFEKPANPILVEQVIESVVPLETCGPTCTRKSQLIPRNMISFNELNYSDRSDGLSDEDGRSIAAPCEPNFNTLITVIQRHKTVYHSLKYFFSVCRVDFARKKDLIGSYSHVSSQLTELCAKRELVVRLYEELRLLKRRIRIQFLEQFLSFFSFNTHLVYNGCSPRKTELTVIVPDFRDKKRRTRKFSAMIRLKRKNSQRVDAVPMKIEVSTLPVESLTYAQELLVDMQDSDFKIDIECDQVLTEITNTHESTSSKILVQPIGKPSTYSSPRPYRENNEFFALNEKRSNSDVCPEINAGEQTKCLPAKEPHPNITDFKKKSLTKFENSHVAHVSTYFNTARGKKIDVRSEGLTRGKEILESVSRSLTSEDINLKPCSQVVAVDENELVGFRTASGRDISINEELLSRGKAMLDSIPAEAIEPITPAGLKESRACKRSLLITSPQRILSEPKRMKSEKQVLTGEKKNPNCGNPETFPSDCTHHENAEDIQESINYSEDLSSSVVNEFLNVRFLDVCRSRSASPEICSSSRRFKSSEILSKNNENPQKPQEFLPDDDSFLIAIENSSWFENDLCLSSALGNKTKVPDIRCDKSQTTAEVIGRNVAASNGLNVSNQASAGVENFPHDVDDECFVQIPESVFYTSKNSTANEITPNDLQNSNSSKINIGFSTAAGCKLNVSQTVLKKAQKIFDDIDEDIIERNFQCPASPDFGIKSKSSSSARLKLSPSFFEKNGEGVGKNLEISTACVRECAQKLSEDVDEYLADKTLECPSSPEIIPNRKVLPKARPKFTDDENVKNTSKMSASFSTAAGNELSVSKSALEGAQKFFEVVEEDLLKETTQRRPASPEIGFKSKSLSRSRLKPRSKNDLKNVQSKVSLSFSTASGNKLSISETAIKKAHQLLEDVEEEVLRCPTSPEIGAKSKNLNQRPKLPRLTPIGNEELLKIEAPKISVSFNADCRDKSKEETTSLEKPEKLFENVDEVLIQKNLPTSDTQVGGVVQRATSPEIGQNSKTSLSTRPKLHKLAHVIDKEETFSKKPISFIAAAGDGIAVPKTAFKRAQKLFQDVNVDLLDETSDPLIGTRLTALDSACWDKENAAVPDEVPKIALGFTTAAGNKLSIPKTNLMKADKNFQSIDNDLINERLESLKNIEAHENVDDRSETSLDSTIPKASESEFKHEEREQDLNKINDANICPFHTQIEISRSRDTSDCISSVSNSTEGEQRSCDFSQRQSTEEAPEKPSELVTSTLDDSLAQQQTSSTNSTMQHQERPRATSPVVGTRRSYQLRRRQKRRSQIFTGTSNSTPLGVVYNGKENESMLGCKSNSEDFLRKIKDTFSQRSNKRKEPAPDIGHPVPKRSKESRSVSPPSRKSLTCNDVLDKSNKDGRSKCDSRLSSEENTRRITLREAVDGVRPGRYTTQELLQFGLRPEVISVNSQNAGQFVFSSQLLNDENVKHVHGDQCKIVPNENNEVGFKNLACGFLASPEVDPRLISEEWIGNHYRWIVWKLSAFEKSYPYLFAKKYLTLDNVLRQLKYRYDREINQCERSALKRIVERDDSSSKAMVLCVASMKPISCAFNEFELELTDGWYSVWSQLDLEMNNLIVKKRVVIGTKILIMNAELVGASQGCDPLKTVNSVRLKIATNSTRLARWDTRLGFRSCSSLPLIRELKSVLPNGGVTYPVFAIIARVYPMLYMEKKAEGYSELYNEKVAFKKAADFNKERQDCLEQLASVITREVEKENDIDDSDDYVKTGMSVDMVELQNQRILNQDRLNSLIRERIESRMPEQFHRQRKVLRLLKIRIVDECKNDRGSKSSAVVTVWNPSDDVASLFKEGKLYVFHNLCANDVRYEELQLTINRTTRYEEQSMLPKRTDYQRCYTAIGHLTGNYASLFNEVDTVGIVLGSEVNDGNQQIIYLADLWQNILAVKFRFDLKDYGFEDVLKRKCIVAAINLQWKGGIIPSSKIPYGCVTEYTTFTQKSKQLHLQSHLNEFMSYFKSKCLDTFVEECEKKRTYLTTQCQFPTATSTPVKWTTSKNSAANCTDVSDISVSSINTSANTEKSLKSKDTRSRIDKLRQYGEPPPLSPITLSSASNVRRRPVRLSILSSSFKSNDCKSKALEKLSRS